MSKQDVRKFWEKLEKDGKLQERLQPLAEKPLEESVGEIVKAAASVGCSFTKAEYVAEVETAVKEQMEERMKAQELSSGTLERAAGGTAAQTTGYTCGANRDTMGYTCGSSRVTMGYTCGASRETMAYTCGR